MSNHGVALRKESVDRNFIKLLLWGGLGGSLSARRAWIEISLPIELSRERGSLSARRAWIEICGGVCAKRLVLSSLSARRAWIEILAYPDMIICTNGRSPQGERG